MQAECFEYDENANSEKCSMTSWLDDAKRYESQDIVEYLEDSVSEIVIVSWAASQVAIKYADLKNAKALNKMMFMINSLDFYWVFHAALRWPSREQLKTYETLPWTDVDVYRS